MRARQAVGTLTTIWSCLEARTQMLALWRAAVQRTTSITMGIPKKAGAGLPYGSTFRGLGCGCMYLHLPQAPWAFLQDFSTLIFLLFEAPA